MLSIKDVRVCYDGHEVLDDFSLDLDQGEIFALLGQSGSGKSSLLRFVAGLENTQRGEVVLDGRQLSSQGQHLLAPEHREIGMVFQNYALFPHMNVEQNIAFGVNQLSKAEKAQKVSTLLQLIDLPGIENKYPHQLSGGEQQRVALARALAPSPKLLLLDEPFSNLDTLHREQLTHQVRRILKAANISAIFVTHDQSEANTLADRVGTINNEHLTIK